MPSLILFRHGKSDWLADDGNDLARPLSARGRRNARTMGRFLAEAGQLPDRVLASPAERALETLRIAMKSGGWDAAVDVCATLYGGTTELFEELRGQTEAVLLVVGHEPTWSLAVETLIGGGRVRMPTAALARVELDVESWRDLRPGCGELAWLVCPGLFPAEAREHKRSKGE